MGVYDSVVVPCPVCKKEEFFQSKGSPHASCRGFSLQNAPKDVLSNVNRHSPCRCTGCGCYFAVDESARKAIEVAIPEVWPLGPDSWYAQSAAEPQQQGAS